MKAEKLPSGAWRVRVYRDGVRRSFTAPGKKEAMAAAAAWMAGKHEKRVTMKTGEALRAYIESRERVVSPSTLARYVSMEKTYFRELAAVPVDALTPERVQRWVNRMAAEYSPKTCRNAVALLSAAVRMVRPGASLGATLPKAERAETITPSMGDVSALVDYFDGRDVQMLAAVLLGAFGPMRRGEVCALRGRDVDHAAGAVTVRRNLVPAPGGGYVEKGPKTEAGYRAFTLPREVMEKLPVAAPDERLVKWQPHQLDHRFRVACRACGLPGVRFHDLRHFGASILHAWGVPDVYIMQRGGWESDHVMKRVYREALSDEQRRLAGMVSERIGHALATSRRE